MSSSKKTLLGILSFLAVVLIGAWIYYYVRWIMDFIPNAPSYENNPELVLENVSGLIGTTFALLLPAGLISLGLLIYYIIQIVNNHAMDTGERVVWIVTLILFCPLTFPIYWLMRVRTLPPPGAQPVQPTTFPQGPTYS